MAQGTHHLPGCRGLIHGALLQGGVPFRIPWCDARGGEKLLHSGVSCLAGLRLRLRAGAPAPPTVPRGHIPCTSDGYKAEVFPLHHDRAQGPRARPKTPQAYYLHAVMHPAGDGSPTPPRHAPPRGRAGRQGHSFDGRPLVRSGMVYPLPTRALAEKCQIGTAHLRQGAGIIQHYVQFPISRLLRNREFGNLP